MDAAPLQKAASAVPGSQTKLVARAVRSGDVNAKVGSPWGALGERGARQTLRMSTSLRSGLTWLGAELHLPLSSCD